MSTMLGRVKVLKADKGFGFIAPNVGRKQKTIRRRRRRAFDDE
jgi:cold shock CspA family protein